jgi:hypothetical protein
VQWRHRCAPLSLPHFCAPIPARFLRRIDQQRASNSQRIPAGAYSPKAPIRRQSGEIRHGCEASVNPILLANWYGTESGGDLAPCTQRLPRAPGRSRSLYRTVLRIRQQDQIRLTKDQPVIKSIYRNLTKEQKREKTLAKGQEMARLLSSTRVR